MAAGTVLSRRLLEYLTVLQWRNRWPIVATLEPSFQASREHSANDVR